MLAIRTRASKTFSAEIATVRVPFDSRTATFDASKSSAGSASPVRSPFVTAAGSVWPQASVMPAATVTAYFVAGRNVPLSCAEDPLHV